MKIAITHDGSCLSVGGGTEDDYCPCGKHDFIKRLRELRLYHWRNAMKLRASQRHLETFKSRSLKDCIARYDKYANEHLTAVQTLNEFFDIGDTAEQDDTNGFYADKV